jgi:hypothetical protein
VLSPAAALHVELELPWPWGGERFALRDIRPLNYIVGPLGSGKTRLALRLAQVIPGAVFMGLDRADNGGAAARMQADDALRLRVDRRARGHGGAGVGRSDAASPDGAALPLFLLRGAPGGCR